MKKILAFLSIFATLNGCQTTTEVEEWPEDIQVILDSNKGPDYDGKLKHKIKWPPT